MKNLMDKICSFLCACILPITVGAGQQYESFTQAIYENMDNNAEVIVYPGTYDIRAEYEEYFGIKSPDELEDNFQYGVWLSNKKITFMPGSKLTCIWDLDCNFSPLYVAKNVVLDGLDLYAEGTLYAIHDDIWREYDAYVNEYRHCRVIGHLLKNANCIGGGVTKHTRIIIDSCYFDNGVADSLTVRYHNTDIPDGQGDIWISNSYFNGYLGLCYYGTTTHLNVYVNGCEAQKIYTKEEISNTPIYNIDLYQWNNNN